MNPEDIKELHDLQKQSFKELFTSEQDADRAVKLVNINSAANTFYELLMQTIPELNSLEKRQNG